MLPTLPVAAFVLVTAIVSILLVQCGRLHRAALVDASEAAARCATILDCTIDAILIVTLAGTVETINAAAGRLLGYADHELARCDLSRVIDIAPGAGSFRQRIGLIDGQLRRSFRTDCTARHRDGRAIAVDVALCVMTVPSGDRLVLSLRDSSERTQIDRVKDELSSTLSRRLRPPRTAIVDSLGLLLAGTAGQLPRDCESLIDLVETDSQRLVRLLDDLLDIDRIEPGPYEPVSRPHDLHVVTHVYTSADD